MTKTYTINNIQITSETIQKLIAENPEILEVKKDGKPEHGTTYWFLSVGNIVANYMWTDDEFDNYRRDIGNFYITEEECIAQQAINYATVRVMAYIRDNELGKEFVNGDDNNYYFTNYKNKIVWQISVFFNNLPPLGYLMSKEACKQVIDNNTADLNLIYGIK